MKNIDKEKILFCLLIAFSVLRLDKNPFRCRFKNVTKHNCIAQGS